jgi:hypothetical protein
MEVLMEWVYFAVVVGLVILGIVYRDRLKSWSFKLNAKANELSGEFTGETAARSNAKQGSSASDVPTVSRSISVKQGNFKGETSLKMHGSDLAFERNETDGISDVSMQGQAIDVSDTKMAGKTRLDLQSARAENSSKLETESGQDDAIPLGEARLQEQEALPPAGAPITVDPEMVSYPELEQH